MNERYDIRWHGETSALLGYIVLDTDEQGALEFAAQRMKIAKVFTVRIMHKGKFIFTLKRDA